MSQVELILRGTLYIGLAMFALYIVVEQCVEVLALWRSRRQR